jgi:peptidoglycan/xylan/chitin deacetylase (PgdA/CDA1 family)
MALHLLHGCVDTWAPGFQSTRNFVSESSLCRFLGEGTRKYERWPENGADPHILTVDDSTRGAARACQIARNLGHEVTIFINPAQIARAQQYFFTVLDAVLDRRVIQNLSFNGLRYSLSDFKQLRAFRQAAKEVLLRLEEHDALSYVDELRIMLGAESAEVSDHAQVMTLRELTDLRDMGVIVENHGWTHAEIAGLNPLQFKEHITRGVDWFAERLGVRSVQYAVPYGKSFVPSESRSIVPGAVFLAHSDLPEGPVGSGHWNRLEITAQLQSI